MNTLSFKCNNCGASISQAQQVRNGLCDQPSCLLTARRHSAATIAAERADLQQTAQRHWDNIQADRPADAIMGVVPFIRPALTVLSQARRSAFQKILQDLIDSVCKQPNLAEAEAVTGDSATVEESAEATVLASACELCGGLCCKSAGNHAYLQPATLHNFLAANHASDATDIMAAYMAHLSTHTYEGSCVFHGAAGCTLPRAMRSDICNRYVCTGLLELRRNLSNSQTAPVYLSAMQIKTVRRWKRIKR
ncbi:MAG: hypothetical protein R3F53_11340 [Gammaproteobacteria bacterium]